MRKMMMLVSVVFSLAACGVDSVDKDRPVADDDAANVEESYGDSSGDQDADSALPGAPTGIPGIPVEHEPTQPEEPQAPACFSGKQCKSGACDQVTRTCVSIEELEGLEELEETEEPVPQPLKLTPEWTQSEPTIELGTLQQCAWHSDCESNVCDLSTRTCRDYPF